MTCICTFYIARIGVAHRAFNNFLNQNTKLCDRGGANFSFKAYLKS